MSFITTPYFNFTAVKEQTPSVNDWAATYWNFISIDRILYGVLDHTHNGLAALSDPTGVITLTSSETGGTLAGGKTYYFVATYIDTQGLETSISPEASIALVAGLDPPAAPTNNDQATPTDIQVHSPGGIQGGSYWYKLSYLKGGGETLCSPTLYVEIPTDTTYEVMIHFDSLTTAANGADTIRVYRKINSTGSFVQLVDITDVNTSYYLDDNSGVANCALVPRSTNSTNSLYTITIDLSTLTNFTNAVAINVYYGTVSGVYNSVNSLLRGSTNTYTIDLTDATPGMEYIWTGEPPYPGIPPAVSQTYPSPDKIDLATEVQGYLSLENMPVDMNWYPAADTYTDLSVITGIQEAELRFVVDETAIYAWLGATPAWVKIMDPIVKQTAIADVEESATPTPVEEKLNELLAALRNAGVIAT